MALLHDIGETLSPVNHGEVAASVLRPYISPCNFWILQHHEIFQLVCWEVLFTVGEMRGKRVNIACLHDIEGASHPPLSTSKSRVASQL